MEEYNLQLLKCNIEAKLHKLASTWSHDFKNMEWYEYNIAQMNETGYFQTTAA